MDRRPPGIVIIGEVPGFPQGRGAAARIRSYATGLADAGAEVSVLAVGTVPSGYPWSLDAETSGVWNGIPFDHAAGTAREVPGFLHRRVLDIVGMWRVMRTIRDGARSGPFAALSYGPGLRWIIPAAVACRLWRVPFLHDRSEFPFVHDHDDNALVRWAKQRYIDRVFRVFDGIIVITTMLEEFVRPRMREDAWLLRVPILVDVDRFAVDTPVVPGLVGYAGSLGHMAELESLIVVASRLRTRHPEVRLRLMGAAEPEDMVAIEERIAAEGVADLVEFTGPLSGEEIPRALAACAVLALPREDDVFSRAGMPTKLGEYLATGRPVVVTATGDIPDYITDERDAFVIPPADDGAFERALERALFDPQAPAVGTAGRQTAATAFDARTHMARVLAALGYAPTASS